MAPEILPVIHHNHENHSRAQIETVLRSGLNGAFLISHAGADADIVRIAAAVKAERPGFRVGINLLSSPPQEAVRSAVAAGLDMVWADHMGVDSRGVSALGHECLAMASGAKVDLFASVAFKYQAPEHDPVGAARNAVEAGFIPTTSGPATGSPPSLGKVEAMSAGAGGKLAVASGITPENVSSYARHLRYILVSTGVSFDEFTLSEGLLRRLIAAVSQA